MACIASASVQLAAWVRNRAGRVVLRSNEIEYLHVADRHATRLFQTLRIDWYKVGVLRCLAVVVRRSPTAPRRFSALRSPIFLERARPEGRAPACGAPSPLESR